MTSRKTTVTDGIHGGYLPLESVEGIQGGKHKG